MTTITQHMSLRLLGGHPALPVPADFTYCTGDPFAVVCTFHLAGEEITWLFARDLCEMGMVTHAGLGDVTMWPVVEYGAEMVCVALSAPEGEALLQVPVCGLRPFIDETYEVVPAGSEWKHFDWDAIHAELLPS